MSDDGIRWCKTDESDIASYTLLPITHRNTSSKCARRSAHNGDVLNLRQHRNHNRTNRDIRSIRTRSDSDGSVRHSDNSHSSPSAVRCSKSYLYLNICLVLALHIICNEFVTSVNCDELSDAVGHFTHTWAVHIPGGDAVAAQVAADHDMHLRGKVSLTVNCKVH